MSHPFGCFPHRMSTRRAKQRRLAGKPLVHLVLPHLDDTPLWLMDVAVWATTHNHPNSPGQSTSCFRPTILASLNDKSRFKETRKERDTKTTELRVSWRHDELPGQFFLHSYFPFSLLSLVVDWQRHAGRPFTQMVCRDLRNAKRKGPNGGYWDQLPLLLSFFPFLSFVSFVIIQLRLSGRVWLISYAYFNTPMISCLRVCVRRQEYLETPAEVSRFSLSLFLCRLSLVHHPYRWG
ncbi:hypothetical protein LY76DRAFT_10710 [Colletotrichum caudatum]|nr:hypothetical protein LY76DRAFT_10710 [Colletotrichum caudatum]